MKHVAAIAIAIAVAGVPARAKTLIRCTSAGHTDVTISLQDRTFKGKSLNCISGDFIADMTPCAPTGGYGLSAPTGSAPLGEVVMRWQDYHDAPGPIVGSSVSPETVRFEAGHMTSGGYKGYWTFFASRLTGEGKLIEEGKPPVPYTCALARPRF